MRSTAIAGRWRSSASPANESNCYISPVKFGYVDIPGTTRPSIPAKAQELLARRASRKATGCRSSSISSRTGFYPKTKEYGEVITAMLQEQGFNVKLTVMEVAAWLERIYLKKDHGAVRPT